MRHFFNNHTIRFRAIATKAMVVLVVTSFTMAWRSMADVCSVGGNPYCSYSDLVPCSSGTCVAWSVYDNRLDPPKCQNGSGADVAVVTTVPVASWTNCKVSNDDHDSCSCEPSFCSTVSFYASYEDCIFGNPCLPGINLYKSSAAFLANHCD